MVRTLIGLFLLISSLTVAQQKTFDLATYTVPKGWVDKSTDYAAGYAITNNIKNIYCQLAIYKSIESKGSSITDFNSEWKAIVVNAYKPTKDPVMGSPVNDNGWDVQSGVAPFEFSGAQSAAMLVTITGHGKCMSIVILTNTEDYQQQIDAFLESVDLKKPEVTSQPATTNTATKSLLGTWTASASAQSSYRVNNGVMNYILRQYTFNENGTYSFITKTFDPFMNKILLGKENGTYQISGNNLTIIPQESVLEAWSKKDGTDKWGNFLTTQNISLEKATYQFTKHYFSGVQEWSLVLQTNKATQRDGAFSSNASFTNAYYYSPLSTSHPIIELPGTQTSAQETKKPPVSSTAIKSTFAFNTTNFTDGWTSTEQENWIQVVKGSIKILIHYPNKNADAYNSVLMDGLKNAWNILVAPKYSTASNFEFKPITGWQSIEFAEADAVEKTNGKSVHVVLFKMNYSNGSGKYLEFITPDKQTYEQEFGVYRQESYGWEKVEAMANYNKFAVAVTDLKGLWTSDFTGMIQYVNANTGLDAGANAHASNESFEFMADNTYKWNIGVASGMVGNMKFESAKSTGKYSLPNNWQIYFSDLEGKPKTYNAYFSCIKGARLLWLEDSAYTIGYTAYGKKE